MARALLVALLVGGTVCSSAWASEPATGEAGSRFTLSGSIGVALLQADQYLFEDDGSYASHLIWKSDPVPVATFEAGWQGEGHWAVLGSLSVALDHTGYMEDYDWFDPGRDWTHRSQHPDTDLERYVALDLGARYDLLRRDEGTFGLRAGFRYTDVKWTAYGGNYVYSSDGGFRDLTGSFSPEKGITFHQMLPAFYLGPSGSARIGRATFSASLVGGLTFAGSATDDHWRRDLHFELDLGEAPYLGVQARLDYPLASAVSLFLNADYQRNFLMRGPYTAEDTTTGASEYIPGNPSGAAFQSLRLDAGLSLRF
ncbi:plasminogen activator [Tistlia consotensis]|uniref:Plasminogen activator n=1 Tax=Tistlia consotensis USBA 355 TaxID=560819 RepID=A0A1Y6B9Q1_9PROT|nr:omptin family outer membrane protease [Tistlia consotensis]SMF00415.1 plasminogen activator [Tistlia consotensis USBA 355]SNR75838.1 plasminogen activator [Tistlia consotensis]